MHRLFRLAITVAPLCVLLLAAPAQGYDTYGNGCDSCHDFFRGNPDLHDTHRFGILTGGQPNACVLCHRQNSNFGPPVNTFRSRGGLPGPAPSNLGCAGCHGNDYGAVSRTDGQPKATAKGLRARHAAAGITTCAGCHSIDDTGTIFGENIAPPYYQRADVVPKDPCNADGNEGRWVAPVNRGLDNDGDLAYDGADPDCVQLPTGACCSGVTCSVDTQANCAALGGAYQGDGTVCTPTTCAAACTVLPGVIQLLQAVKEPNRADARFSWSVDASSSFYRVYCVNAKLQMAPPPVGNGPPRGGHPDASLRCSTPDQTTLSCVDVGSVPPAAGMTLFYQAVGVCSPGDIEGPN